MPRGSSVEQNSLKGRSRRRRGCHADRPWGPRGGSRRRRGCHADRPWGCRRVKRAGRGDAAAATRIVAPASPRSHRSALAPNCSPAPLEKKTSCTAYRILSPFAAAASIVVKFDETPCLRWCSPVRTRFFSVGTRAPPPPRESAETGLSESRSANGALRVPLGGQYVATPAWSRVTPSSHWFPICGVTHV